MEPSDVVQVGNVEISKLGLGTAPFGGLFTPVSQGDATETVRAAHTKGIRWFDTAPLYGYGTAEKRLGHGLEGLLREGFVISSKVGRLLRVPRDIVEYEYDESQVVSGNLIYRDTGPEVPVFDYSYQSVRRSIEESLFRLGLDRLDMVFVHDVDDHVEDAIAGALPALWELRNEGAIGCVGVSSDYVEPLAPVISRCDLDCVLVAGRWTLLDRAADESLLSVAHSKGVKVLAAGVFNSGILADIRTNATFDYAPAGDKRLEEAHRLATVCEGFGVDLKAAALQFPLRHPAVAAVLVGARSPAEILESIELSRTQVPEALWAALDEVLRS